MLKRILAGLLLCLCVGLSRPGFAQPPPPVDLGIVNFPQETQVWCWAAVAQQVIVWLTGGSPPQCALVETALEAPPGICCVARHPDCVTAGALGEIQFLIDFYGGSYSEILPPTDPFTLYETLAAGHPIILAVRSTPFSGHVVVLTGMAWLRAAWGYEPVLYINDPMNWGEFAEPVPFERLLPFWDSAIVVD